MQVAWLGNTTFEAMLRERLPGPIVLTPVSQGLLEQCTCLLVQGLKEAPRRLGSVPLIRVLAASELDSLSSVPGALGLVVLDSDGENLREVVRTYAAGTASLRVEEVIRGPVAHDVRGAVGIIHLVKQVLEASDAENTVGTRLDAAAAKIQYLLEDLELTARSPLRDRAPSTEESSWTQAIQRTTRWQECLHRRREVKVLLDAQLGPQRSPPHASFVLRALLDTSLRLSASSVALSVDAGSPLICRSECQIESPDDELRRLADRDLAEQQLPEGKSFLFRLIVAAQLLVEQGGQLEMKLAANTLVLSAHFHPS